MLNLFVMLENIAWIVLGLCIFVLLSLFLRKMICDILRDNKEYLENKEIDRRQIEQEKQYEIYKKIVLDNSKRIQKIICLNNSINIHYIGENGCITEEYYAKTKKSYDAITINDKYDELILAFRDEIEYFLSVRKANELIYENYVCSFNSFQTEMTEEECSLCNISFDTFQNMEDKISRSLFLHIPRRFAMKFIVGFTPEKDKKRPSKTIILSYIQLEKELEAISQRERIMETEEYTRKRERGKMTPSLRYDILKRDGFRCCVCGNKASENVILEVDHIIPISKGGTTEYSNLQTLCRDCNRGKGAK